MMRSGYVPAHTSWCQSFHARTHASPSSWSLAAREHRAREPGDERREAERRPDAGEVHVGDAGVDVPAALAHLVEARRLHAPLVLRPADHRVEPDVREQLVLVGPRLACRRRTRRAAARASASVRGHPAVEQVGRLDEVVVDGDDREAARARLRVGQQRHLASASARTSTGALRRCRRRRAARPRRRRSWRRSRRCAAARASRRRGGRARPPPGAA